MLSIFSNDLVILMMVHLKLVLHFIDNENYEYISYGITNSGLGYELKYEIVKLNDSRHDEPEPTASDSIFNEEPRVLEGGVKV